MSRQGLHEEWIKEMDNFRASGQTAKAWCADHGVNIHRFRYWAHKLRTAQQDASTTREIRWLSVDTAASDAGSDDGLTVMVGDVRILVRPGFNPILLSQLVRTLADAR